MTDSESEQPTARSGARPLIRHPWPWLVLTAFFALVAAYFHLRGAQASMLAVSFSVLALASLAGLAWTLGARDAGDPVAALLRRAADASPDGVVVTGRGGAFTYTNAAFGRLFAGARSLDAIEDRLDEPDVAQFRRLRAGAEAGTGGSAEIAFAGAGATREWRRLTVTPLDDAQGALWRAEDVTARREVDAVRHAEETGLADYLDLLPVGFFSADADGRVRHANQTLADWIGVAPEDMTGRALDDFLADGGAGGRTVPENEGAAELTFRRADGGSFQAAVVQSLGGRGGGPAGGPEDDQANGQGGRYSRSVVLPGVDWRQMADRLDDTGAGAEIRLHWLFDEAPVGIVLLDLAGNIAECNRAFLTLVGLNPEVLIGKPFTDRVAQEDRGDIAAQLSKVVMGTARATHMEIRMPGAGQRDLATSVFASRLENALGDISGLALHFIDTTEQKDLEVQFAQSQKMQAVGQLAGGVAHDFNNLLTAMIGFADLLLARHGPDDPSFGDIQQIRQNANRATNLVRQLLAFSRKQTLTPVRLDVTEALSELSNLLGRLIGEKIDLVIEHGRDLTPVRADKGQFDQVVINLAVNARDAMPGGGQLTVRSSPFELVVPAQRGADVMPAGRYVLIEVVDTGVGIAKEDMERIFEPFFSTKEVGAGTGLGLSTVYGIVHQTGGFVAVDSAPGQGTTFRVYLPEYTEEEAEDAATARAADADAQVRARTEAEGPAAEAVDLTGAGTVLLVEDEDAVRMFGARALRNKGYTVLEAVNGESALDVVGAAEGPIDLIISDVVMPGMDGHTLVQLVRHELPDVKVILMSGYAEDVFTGEIERDPTISFLAKPFSLKGLASKVKDVMAG